jgi:hypothetical protein
MPAIQSSIAKSDKFSQLVSALESWTIPEGAIDTVHDLAKISLNEVKALTEYEDGKVSRLLTVAAFLSAVVGTVFTKYWSAYSWPTICEYSTTLKWWLPFFTYAAFFAYIMIVGFSTVTLLKAIGPSFNIPASWRKTGAPSKPTSMLFYKGILDVTAEDWGKAFVTQAGTDGKPLKSVYAKCYIAEAYLVAEKVGTKLRREDPGVRVLRYAMIVLLVFFILVGATILSVDAQRG